MHRCMSANNLVQSLTRNASPRTLPVVQLVARIPFKALSPRKTLTLPEVRTLTKAGSAAKTNSISSSAGFPSSEDTMKCWMIAKPIEGSVKDESIQIPPMFSHATSESRQPLKRRQQQLAASRTK